ncbi:MAG: PAS domain-containing protein, partial [Myxococcota bacterium]|nr:PAS domain-containing protein [Myxococcota bacterium]
MEATGEEVAALCRRVSELETDLARHRSAEARRRESDEVHRITLENIADAVFITDYAGSLTFICPNVEVIFARSRDEVRALGNISKLLGEGLFDPDRLETEGEIRNIERPIVDGAGRRHVLIVSVKRVDIQGGTVLYTCRDITDRKLVEDALHQSEARLREAQSIAGMGFWDWNITTNDLYWSEEIYRIFGLSESDFGATYDAFLESIHPDDRAFVEQKVEAAVHEGAEYSIDHRVVRPGGETRYVHELGRVTRDDQGSPQRMVGTVIDITARKRAEEARNAAETRARFVEELAALGTLIAGLAHDVGTPVNVILGYARMMEQSLA